MIIIKDLINERQQYALGVKTTPWKDELLAHVIEAEDRDEVAFITVGSTLFEKRKIDAIQNKYSIVGAYKIGNIFTNTRIPFYIVHLSKIPSTGLKVALFNGESYDYRDRTDKKDGFAVPISYTEDWATFIYHLESWINGGEMPESNDTYEFRFVPKNQFFKDSLSPETYSRENIELRELMDKQDTKALSDLADILSPRVDVKSDDEVKVLRVKDLNYPLDVAKIETDKPTSIILQKGDVVIPKINTKTKAYLFNYDGNERIYASQHLLVIKCKDILPEYLYLYLNSEISVKVLNARYVGVSIQRITAKEIADLPIATPTQDEQKYITDFNTLTNFRIRDYGQFQRMNAYYEHLTKIHEKKEKPKVVEDILNMELADNIRAYREDQLRSFLSDDLKELNTCFRGKAYKATLILAGSILEAVLIDWLSEIHHKNYFEEEYYVTDRNGREKRADLIDYINEIKYLRRPRWMDEAAKAHEIRKKRNLVHAKLCLQSDDINEEVCREVISYLSDVLKTRGVTTQR